MKLGLLDVLDFVPQAVRGCHAKLSMATMAVLVAAFVAACSDVNGKPAPQQGQIRFTEPDGEFYGDCVFAIAFDDVSDPHVTLEFTLYGRAGFGLAFDRDAWNSFLAGEVLTESYFGGPFVLSSPDGDPRTASLRLIHRVPLNIEITLFAPASAGQVGAASIEGEIDLAECFDPDSDGGASERCVDFFDAAELETFGASLSINPT